MVIERNVVHAQTAAASAAPPRALDVASCDWDALYAAVLARLRHFSAATGVSASPAADLALCEGVRDCVAALEQLRLTMTHEQSLRRESEARAFELRLALQQAHQELAELRACGHHARHQALYEDSGHSVGMAALSQAAMG
jgi:hypothetical protein